MKKPMLKNWPLWFIRMGVESDAGRPNSLYAWNASDCLANVLSLCEELKLISLTRDSLGSKRKWWPGLKSIL